MWDKLSMKEKAAFMKVAIKNGLYGLEEIRNRYNEFAKGGPLKSYDDGGFLSKLSSAFRNATIGAAMADNPAIMTASGWRQNEKGNYVQDNQNSEGAIKLRNNLADISMMSPTHPATAITDAIIGKAFIGAGKLKNYLTYNKSYTGVPAKALNDGSGKTMAETFPDYNGTVWTSNSPDYARSYASGLYAPNTNGKIYTVYGPKTDMLEVPLPKDGASVWQDLPLEVSPNGDIIPAKNIFSRTKEVEGKNVTFFGNNRLRNQGTALYMDVKNTPGITTDDVVKYSKNIGKRGTVMRGVEDGTSTSINGDYFFEPLDEIIYNSGKDLVKVPYGTSNIKVLKAMPSGINTTPQYIYPFFNDIYNTTMLPTVEITAKRKKNKK